MYYQFGYASGRKNFVRARDRAILLPKGGVHRGWQNDMDFNPIPAYFLGNGLRQPDYAKL